MTSEAKAKLGDRVRVQYLGLLHEKAAEKHSGRQVLKFKVGSRSVISGISLGVIGMTEGEKKHLTLQPGDAYGAVRDELIQEIPRERLPRTLDPQIGKWLASSRAPVSRRTRVKIVEVKPTAVVVDGNHPLAGKVLEVEIQLVSLRVT